jgi:tetratricopeptide (TPR) repeat protein
MFFIGWRKRLGTERKELLRIWEDGAFEKAFTLSREELQTKPMDYFLLIFYGFAAYQLAVAQIASADTQFYIDECIWSLRKALLCKEGGGDLRIQYVLGKAYYYKGAGYADLAVRFLEAAQNGAYQARDLPEYLGLSYAAKRDYRNSVAAFSLALASERDGGPAQDPAGFAPEFIQQDEYPSDLLLLSIARSYMALDEQDSAKAYLMRCVETSKDAETVVAARLLLGNIFEKTGYISLAEAQYLALLEEDGENAEAHYHLGELYAAGGDSTRARAEWRKAVRIDPAHRSARSRLNM